MKKFVSAFFILLILSSSVLCLAGCDEGFNPNTVEQVEAYIEEMEQIKETQATTQTEPETEPEPKWPLGAGEAVEIFMDSKPMWLIDSEYDFMYGSYYGFLDMDFDGVCELVTSVCDGTGRFSTNKYYRIDPDTKSVYELSLTSPIKSYETGEIAHDYALNDLLLYKDIYNGQYKYLGIDLCSVSIQERTTNLMDMYMKGGKLLIEPTYVYYHFDATDSGGGVQESYSVYLNKKWNDTSKAKYNKMLGMYEDASVNLRYEFISGSSIEGAGSSTQKSMLLSSYNTFTFDGYVGG